MLVLYLFLFKLTIKFSIILNYIKKSFKIIKIYINDSFKLILK